MMTKLRVRGFDRRGGWLFRLLVAAAMAAAVAAPKAALALDAPKWVAALHVAAQGAVGLRWTPVPGATAYKVLRSTTAGSGYAEIASVATPQHFDKDLQPGTTYYYVLQAVAGAEVSANSLERSVAIPGEKKVEAMKPPALRDPTLSQTTEFGKTTSKVGVVWDRVDRAVAYNLYRSTVKGKDYQMISSVSETNYVDAAVETGKTYYYVVTALDEQFQETPHSAEKSVEVKEPEKKAAVAKKEKVKIMFRASRQLFEIKEGDWGKLVQPTAVAVSPDGEIYVTDTAQNQVFVFSGTGEFQFAFGKEELNNPMSISFSADGRTLLVAHDKGNVVLYNDDGKLRKVVDFADLLPKAPADRRSIARVRGGSDDRWFMTNARDHKFYVFDDAFKLQEEYGSEGGELDQFVGPVGIVEDKDGTIVVADGFNFQVKLWKDGKAIAGFGSYGNSVGQFARLVDVAVLDDGEILALDFLNATVQSFGRDGKFNWVLATQGMDAQVPFATPGGFTVAGKRLYVAQVLAGKLGVYELLDEVGPPKIKK